MTRQQRKYSRRIRAHLSGTAAQGVGGSATAQTQGPNGCDGWKSKNGLAELARQVS
jgi:hypothetical protein